MKTDNSYYLKNESLPTAKTEFEWTPEMVQGLQKAKGDIIYFAENYFHIVNLDRGKEIIKLYKAQKRILKSMVKNNRVILLSSRQAGKALAVDTPIPTPTGYILMGDLKDGDKVYDENGNICNVVKAHDIMYNRPCYKITFDTGEQIIADEEHLWFTQTSSEKHKKIKGSVKTTKEISHSLFKSNTLEPNHRIPKHKALCGTEKQLIIDPYILGVWLGDEHSASSRISIGKDDIDVMSQLLNQPYFTITNDGHDNFNYSINGENKKDTTDCFKKQIRQLNILNNKHIPIEYLMSSKEQRLELLKGLMDTDGYACKKGKLEITSSNPKLAKDIIQLVRSLGYKTNLHIKTFKNPNWKPSYRISFTPDTIVFKLPRKIERQQIRKLTPKWNRVNYSYIKNIESCESVPVRCITVDSPNSLYLCGETNQVTHNTTLVTIFALWYTSFNPDKSILVVANKEKTAIEILGRIRLAYELLPNWLKSGTADYSKTDVKFTNGSRVYVSTTASTAGRSSSINCIIGSEPITIKNKQTNEIITIPIEDLFLPEYK